tara:strand:+ start:322 stop:1788 length:1467 start_codon:yes stop_codon:yes gene_type:complete
MKRYNIVGSGFAGLSAAASLAFNKKDVHIIEKNTSLGGRARQFKSDGFVFDMGPSWYWMPDVFDRFFKKFGKKASDYYDLIQLNPGFQIIFENYEEIKLNSSWDEILSLFEAYEKGSADRLNKFMIDAEQKYNIGMTSLVYNPAISFFEFFRKDVLFNITKMNLFTSYRKHVRKYFKHPYLRMILEFPVLFLGTAPQSTPALYSLMAYSGLKQGTFYPKGGFGKVIEAMVDLCQELGVEFHTDSEVKECSFNKNKIKNLITSKTILPTDYVICAADYHHFDRFILPDEYSNYSHRYWDSRVMSPSCLIYYLGVNKKIPKLEHHNLFFDKDIDIHVDDIYKKPKWPTDPLFYVCCPSKTDNSVAPNRNENLFLLLPLASGLNDTRELREKYFNKMIKRIEEYCGEKFNDNIIFKKSYCINDFKEDYNAFKGNAYGLANSLLQTANLKPKIINKKIPNLFYTGQLTVPGPGVPPSIISGQVVADYILKNL